jgi:hypothetical protein
LDRVLPVKGGERAPKAAAIEEAVRDEDDSIVGAAYRPSTG